MCHCLLCQNNHTSPYLFINTYSGGRRGVGIFKKSPDYVPQSSATQSLKLINLQTHISSYHTSSQSSVGYRSPIPRSATVYLCIISHFLFVYGTHLIILGQLVVRHRQEPGGSLQRVGTARLEVEGAQSPVLQLTHEVLSRRFNSLSNNDEKGI